jgi:hypothetical protein
VFGEIGFDVSPRISRSRPVAAGSTMSASSTCTRRRPEGSPEKSGRPTLTDAETKFDENGSVYKLNSLPLRSGPHGVRDLFGGFRVGGANPVRPTSILPRRIRLGRAEELRARREDGVAEQPAPLQYRAYYMDWSDFAVRSRTRRTACSSWVTSTCRLPRIRGFESELPLRSTTPGRSTRRSAGMTQHVSEATSYADNDDTGECL